MGKKIIEVNDSNLEKALALVTALHSGSDEDVEKAVSALEASGSMKSLDEVSEEFDEDEAYEDLVNTFDEMFEFENCYEAFCGGVTAAMKAAADIMKMPLEDRKQVFGTIKMTDILNTGLDAFTTYADYAYTDDDEVFEAGDKVLVDGDECYVLEDQGEAILLIDSSFHKFLADRSEVVRKTA